MNFDYQALMEKHSEEGVKHLFTESMFQSCSQSLHTISSELNASTSKTCNKDSLTDSTIETQPHSEDNQLESSLHNTKFLQNTYQDSQFTMQKETKQILCNLCCKSFSRISNLKTHVIRVHSEEGQHTCKVCDKVYFSRACLEKHIGMHAGEFVCNICNKSFNKLSYLKTHLRIHIGKKPFVCGVCGKGFIKNTYLKTHFRVHTGEKPFVCTVCSKSFTQNVHLKTHLRLHTGQRPFVCKLCDKTFARDFCYKMHFRMHTKEKPFHCNICIKSFSQKSNLTRHLLVHTSKKALV